MKSKILAILAVFVMVASCLAVVGSVDSNADEETETFTIDPSDTTKGIDALKDGTYWVMAEANKKSCTLSNPDGFESKKKCNLEIVNFNGGILHFSNDFVVPSGCSIVEQDGGSHPTGDTYPQTRTFIGFKGEETFEYTNFTVKGSIKGLFISALHGNMIIDGGSYDDGIGSERGEYDYSVFFRYSAKSPENVPTVTVKNGGKIISADICTRNGTFAADKLTEISVKNLVSAPIGDAYTEFAVKCNTRHIFTLSGPYVCTERSDIVFKSNTDTEAKLIFDGVTYKNVKYIDIQNYAGNIEITDSFSDDNVIFLIDANNTFENRITITKSGDTYLYVNYAYYDETSGYISDAKSYAALLSDGKVTKNCAFIFVDKTEGIADLKFNVTTYQDNYIAAEIGNAYDIMSNITVTCEDGWEFMGWYYHDANGVEKKITDASAHVFDETVVIYAKAIKTLPTPPVPPTPEEINYGLIVGIMVLLVIFTAFATATLTHESKPAAKPSKKK